MKWLNDWGSSIFTIIILVGLGTAVVIQNISATAAQIKLHQRLIDVHHYNGVLSTDNAVKALRLEQANELLEQQHRMLQDMYNELMEMKGFPRPDKDRPSRSDA
jgi:hypothetical protein